MSAENEKNSSLSAKFPNDIGVSKATTVVYPSHWRVVGSNAPRENLHSTHLRFKDSEAGVHVAWNSRAHRKGRFPVVTPIEVEGKETVKEKRRTIWWAWEFGNISWWVGQFFLWGSIAWIINGFLVFVPAVMDQATNAFGGGITALIGGTLFECGAFLMLIEALNVNEEVQFGYAVECLLKGIDNGGSDKDGDRDSKKEKRFRWWGFRWHEIGYRASFIQLWAASIFWIATFTGVPGVISMDNVGLVQGLYWTPQIIGGSGFIIASLLFMAETQRAWYIVEPYSLGWHVGFWNLVGAIGFTLCGIFGLFAFAGRYQTWGTTFSTFWGGWSFLIGSYVQLFEVINKHPSS